MAEVWPNEVLPLVGSDVVSSRSVEIVMMFSSDKFSLENACDAVHARGVFGNL